MGDLTEAVLRGEATLRSIALQMRQARITAAQGRPPGAQAAQTDRTPWDERRMGRVERFCWHALSSLPEDEMERLRALYDHLQSVSLLAGG